MTKKGDFEIAEAIPLNLITGSRDTVKDQSGNRAFIYSLVGICLLIGTVARIISIRLLTNNPLVRAPFLDDGFYYLQIARNVATLGKFTFDGINLTNGFHPLWELLLVLIAHISVEDFVFIRLVMYFSILLYVLTGILLFKFVAGYGGPVAGLAAVILWSFSPDLILWQNQGMENTIFLPILIFALIQFARYLQHPDNLRDSIILGVTFGLLMWSRSDSVLFVIIALSGIVIYSWRKFRPFPIQYIRTLAIVVGFTFLLGIGYLLFNYYAAGSILSVSSIVKIGVGSTSSWPLSQTLAALRVHLSMIWDQFNDLGGLTWWGFNWRIYPFKIITFCWIAVVMVWWVFYFIKKSWRTNAGSNQERKIGLGLILVYALIHTVILITLLRDMLRWTPWYIVPQVLTVIVMIPLVLFPRRMLEEISEKARTFADHYFDKRGLIDKFQKYKRTFYFVSWLLLLSIAILAPCMWVLSVPITGLLRDVAALKTLEPRYELAMWLNDHIPSNARVGMFDAGVTGYFAHAHVINLDGLVNSPDYVFVRRSGTEADYIIKNQIEYLILYYFPPHKMDWWFPSDDSKVCHKLIHVNKYPAPWWGAENVKNYFEVIALRYDGDCAESWQSGFPRDALPPE